jgi:hypothetical protein
MPGFNEDDNVACAAQAPSLESIATILAEVQRQLGGFTEYMMSIFSHVAAVENAQGTSVTPRILQLNFFFSLLAKIRALPFPFLFPFAKP